MSLIEQVARAIRDADIGYSIQLTRLVDGVHTYATVVNGQPAMEFDCYEDASEHARGQRETAKARAAIAVMREACAEVQPSTAENPSESAYERGKFDGVMAYAAAIDAALQEGGE
ncbi:MAG: hypothetical protein ACREDP_22400 [Bradyrhizobium sp.]